MKRAVIYARTSGDDRGKPGDNLQGQLEMCREYCQQHGYTVVAELAEDERGAKGASLDLEQLNRAVSMARGNEFDVLVVRELDRLARTLAKQLIVETEFKRAGVANEYVLGEYPDTPEGILLKNMRAVIAEYEKEKITERTIRGRRRSAKNGSVLVHGACPYGYRSEKLENGRFVLKIHEPEARIVRMLFSWYSDEGLSINSIIKRLAVMGIPTRKHRPAWRMATIRQILANETYAGVWHYGKASSHEPIPVKVPAIIDRATWEHVQEKRKTNWAQSKRNTVQEYLVQHRMRCAHCGKPMRSASRRRKTLPPALYYMCSLAHAGGLLRGNPGLSCDQRKYFRAELVDQAVWDKVKEWMSDPDRLAHELESFKSRRLVENAPLVERLDVIDRLLVENRAAMDRLLDLYLDGTYTKHVLAERKTRLEQTAAGLERERTQLAAVLTDRIPSDEQIRTLREIGAMLADGLEEIDESFAARRATIETLDVTVSLEVNGEQKIVWVFSKPLGYEKGVSIALTGIGSQSGPCLGRSATAPNRPC